MRKLVIIMAMLVTVPSWADDTEREVTEKHAFVGVRLHRNASMSFKLVDTYGGYIRERDDQMGYGVTLGTRINKNVKWEYEFSYTGTELESPTVVDKFNLYSNMLNVYLVKKYESFIEPYIGFGLGATRINAHMDNSILGTHAQDSTFAASWQIMIGVNFDFDWNDRFSMNAGLKYQDYGKVTRTNAGVKFGETVIDATEFYLGAVYKFDLM